MYNVYDNWSIVVTLRLLVDNVIFATTKQHWVKAGFIVCLFLSSAQISHQGNSGYTLMRDLAL